MSLRKLDAEIRERHDLVRHGRFHLAMAPRDFDGRMAKLKKRDFPAAEPPAEQDR